MEYYIHSSQWKYCVVVHSKSHSHLEISYCNSHLPIGTSFSLLCSSFPFTQWSWFKWYSIWYGIMHLTVYKWIQCGLFAAIVWCKRRDSGFHGLIWCRKKYTRIQTDKTINRERARKKNWITIIIHFFSSLLFFSFILFLHFFSHSSPPCCWCMCKIQ